MDCQTLKSIVKKQLEDRIVVVEHEGGCRVSLPLLEPNGDVINVYVTERDGETIVHDGGHIRGLLFEVGVSGASTSDRRIVNSLVIDAGLELDAEVGIAFVRSEQQALLYWIMEVGRTIGVSASLIPSSFPRRRSRGGLGKRTAKEITERLIKEGLMNAIRPRIKYRGVTEQDQHVDLTYTIPENRLLEKPDTTVFILAMDLDVVNPVAKVHRGIATATELSGTETIDHAVDVRIVHSVGQSNGDAKRATRLFKAAGQKHLLSDYSWDDNEDQDRFLTLVGKELAPLLSSQR